MSVQLSKIILVVIVNLMLSMCSATLQNRDIY